MDERPESLLDVLGLNLPLSRCCIPLFGHSNDVFVSKIDSLPIHATKPPSGVQANAKNRPKLNRMLVWPESALNERDPPYFGGGNVAKQHDAKFEGSDEEMRPVSGYKQEWTMTRLF